MHPLTLALWQTPHPADTAKALRRLDTAAARAREAGAHWLVTPEMFLTGYLIDPALIAARAEPAQGPLLARVADIARRHGVGIVTGWPEAHPGGQPFNAACAIGPDGRTLAVHRKIHLFGDGDAQRFTPGREPPARFDWRGWHLGLLICFDVEHPETVAQAAASGAQVLLVPTANMAGFDEVQHALLPRQARESGVAIAYANACGTEGETAYNGLSTVCDARGRLLWQAGRDEAFGVLTLTP